MEEKDRPTHPTKDIMNTVSSSLNNKKICFCVTSSVAIINSISIARELMRHGAEIQIVMSKEAEGLIKPKLFHWATGNAVITEITGEIEHIYQAGERENSMGWADLILICPATANTIGKIAHGLSDNAITAIATAALGSQTPMIIVPAMHESMFRNPILLENIEKLKEVGVLFLGPRIEENKAKVAEPKDVVDFLLSFLTVKQDYIGVNVLLTVGPSREMLDPARFISNPSSGKMGMAIASELVNRGASVTILNGKSIVPPPLNTRVISVTSTQEFVDACEHEMASHSFQLLISTAALSDFSPKHIETQKISSDRKNLTIELKQTPKLISRARELDENLFIVAFKAESQEEPEKMIESAYNRLLTSKVNLIIANSINPLNTKVGFERNTNEVYIIDAKKQVRHLEMASKSIIGSQIVDLLREIL